MIRIPQIRKFLVSNGLRVKTTSKIGQAAHTLSAVRLSVEEYVPDYAILVAEAGDKPQRALPAELEDLVRLNHDFNQADVFFPSNRQAYIKLYKDGSHFDFQIRKSPEKIDVANPSQSDANILAENESLKDALAQAMKEITSLKTAKATIKTDSKPKPAVSTVKHSSTTKTNKK